MLTIIAAASENNALGKDNQLVWHLPDDFKRFEAITKEEFEVEYTELKKIYFHSDLNIGFYKQ